MNQLLRGGLWTLPVLALLAAAPWLVTPYLLYTGARMVAIGLLAVSVAVLTAQAGLPTLGQAAPYAVGAYTTGLLIGAGHAAAPLLLLAAAVAAAGFSAVVGLVAVRTRGVVFLMVTLAIGELTAVGADQWHALTGGTDGLSGIAATRPWPGAEPLLRADHLYWYTLVVAGLAVAAVWLLLRGPAGRLLRACRDHETRMHASGHPVHRYLLLTYVGTGALAGVAGSLLVSVQRYVSPADVGFQVSALVLLAVVLGGAHSIAGALAGAVVVVAVRDWAATAVPGHGPLLLGLVFITAVYALPAGVAGTVSSAVAQIRAATAGLSGGAARVVRLGSRAGG